MTKFKWLTVAAASAAALIAMPASAFPIQFFGVLSGAAEAPPNASTGTGTVFVTYDDAAFTLRVQTTFSGLLGNVTNSHIHCCTAVPKTGTAGVATATPTFPGFPSGVTSGSYDQTFNLLNAASWNAAFITANTDIAGAISAFSTGLMANKTYLNIHTAVVPGGEIRAFLTQVPEPASIALTLSALGLVAGFSRGKQRRS